MDKSKKMLRVWFLPVKRAWHSRYLDDGKLRAKSKIQRMLARSRVFFRTLLSREKPLVSGGQCAIETHIGLATTCGTVQNVGTASQLWTRLWSSCQLRAHTYAAYLRREIARRLTLRGDGRIPLFTFVGFTIREGATLLTQDDQLESVCCGIREALCQLSNRDTKTRFSDETHEDDKVDLAHFELGSVLSKGCNAVVYSAKWKLISTDDGTVLFSEDVPCQTLAEKDVRRIKILSSGEFMPVHQQALVSRTVPVGRLWPNNLAIKMMFNYDVESNALSLWKAMKKEAIPSQTKSFGGQQISSSFSLATKKKRLPPHPNIVEMHCTFVDRVPALPEGMTLYPQALPSRLNLDGCGRNMTLFLVMKRYHCTLQEYLHVHQPSKYTSLLLLSQLLEGIVHLERHGIAHRDLKTDNILLDLTHGVANPLLAITDFGCCLAEDMVGLRLPFPTDEISRGGNSALMAPEVLNAVPGPFASIDYSKADLWATGAMAYEIYGQENPFYPSSKHYINSSLYKDGDLPPVGSNVPSIVQRLITDILRYKSEMRPSPSVAATVCQLLLHGPPQWISSGATPPTKNQVLEWIALRAALTYCQSRSQKTQVGPAELQLQITFLSRVQLHEVMQALKYLSLC